MAADSLAGLVVVGCSRRKLVTSGPVPALDRYQGWYAPPLRARLAAHPEYRSRVLVMSARWGLLRADHPVATYEQPLTAERARELRGPVRRALARHLSDFPAREALLLLEPAYLRLLGTPGVPVAHTISRPGRFADACRLLDAWGWPS
ncbi:hypothetical protein RM780_11810 [Streptomyces sp. DSM 44917]|uniref:Uncharacterized protein n=1 Tax=Streptomyces boetiae TaxID=3075541 RepID=A0ABU2L7U2_9ACTN|nr:hypothetical protein [Streptomyces sp. DSM 44917]MDT0307645.1 hypothetical protein [Streptomyces sp. DSM 44917]